MKYGFVGGEQFDPVAVADYLKGLPAGSVVVTGDGRGFEQFVSEQAPELGYVLVVPPLMSFFFEEGKHGPKIAKAKALQVSSIFTEILPDGTLVLGSGGRAEAAREILKRANWGIEVVEL